MSDGPAFSLRRGAGLLLAVLAAVFGALRLAGWRLQELTSFWSDLPSYFTPKYAYAAERIARGELPLWNPYEFCGIPFLATIQPAVFYPPLRLVYAVLSGDAAYAVFFGFHLVLGALSMLALVRSLGLGLWPSVLAASWVTTPLWLLRIYEHPIVFSGIVWTPLLVLLTRRLVLAPSARGAAALALVAALQAVSGYPPLLLASAYILVLGLPFWCWEGWRTGHAAPVAGRAVAALALAALGAGLLASAQIVPTAVHAVETGRLQETGSFRAETEAYGESAPEWMHLLAMRPATFGGTLVELWRENGPVLILLAFLAPALRSRSPAVWYACALVALSALTPSGLLLRLPLYEIVRFGIEWTFFVPAAVHWLAALGLDAAARRTRAPAPAVAAAALAALGLFSVWNWREVERRFPERRDALALSIPSRVFELCDLGPGGSRIFWPKGQVRGTLVGAGLASIGGFEQSLLPQRIRALSADVGMETGPIRSRWDQRLAEHPDVAARMGLECVIAGARRPQLEAAGFERMPGTEPPALIYRTRNVLPRARLVHAAIPASSADAARALVLGGTLDPRATVVIEGGAPLAACAAGAGGATREARITGYEPERVVVRTDSPCESYLVLADTHAPGWSATVDGDAAPIATADYVFRAVRLPPGEHEVRFRYAPASVRAGLALSCAGALLCAALVALPPARDPLRPRGP